MLTSCCRLATRSDWRGGVSSSGRGATTRVKLAPAARRRRAAIATAHFRWSGDGGVSRRIPQEPLGFAVRGSERVHRLQVARGQSDLRLVPLLPGRPGGVELRRPHHFRRPRVGPRNGFHRPQLPAVLAHLPDQLGLPGTDGAPDPIGLRPLREAAGRRRRWRHPLGPRFLDYLQHLHSARHRHHDPLLVVRPRFGPEESADHHQTRRQQLGPADGSVGVGPSLSDPALLPAAVRRAVLHALQLRVLGGRRPEPHRPELHLPLSGLGPHSQPVAPTGAADFPDISYSGSHLDPAPGEGHDAPARRREAQSAAGHLLRQSGHADGINGFLKGNWARIPMRRKVTARCFVPVRVQRP